MFGQAYQGRRVLLTGHTGFKGSWLALWLARLDAQVCGIALPPLQPRNHWDLLDLRAVRDLRFDIRDAGEVARAVAAFAPEIVFHLAAQPLVRHSYAQPLDTWSTNVMGTAHVLQACRATPSVRAIVVVTTDKCYRNTETQRPYGEDDPLGGHDPYSASKAATEILVESWRRSFLHEPAAALLASARAGNVIGGGDWSPDRLVPDVARAALSGEPMRVRSPEAVRPWQHVLDSLSGYLFVGQRLLQGSTEAATAWNFGPRPQDTCTVAELLDRLQAHWPAVRWQREAPGPRPHEAGLLRLDIGKAQGQLGWQPVWRLDDAVAHTARWYQAQAERGAVSSREQLARYEADARRQEAAWALA